jgi:hypothetical protein
MYFPEGRFSEIISKAERVPPRGDKNRSGRFTLPFSGF